MGIRIEGDDDRLKRYVLLPPTPRSCSNQRSVGGGGFLCGRMFFSSLFVEHKWLRQARRWGGGTQGEDVNIGVMAGGYSCPPTYLSTSLRGQLSD